ncbi:MAG: ExbD/TolR family protein [Rhodospirillaceae bacterium]
MGVQLASGGGGRRGSRRKAFRQMSEINVTPFVDVMLVLLIVFMVTAPLLTVGVPVDLPKTNAPPLAVEKDKEPLYVSVKPDGTIWVQETPVDLAALAPKLTAVTGANPETRVLVRGDRANSYGRMVEVLGAISGAGFKKIGLAAELPGAGAPAKAAGGKPAPSHAAKASH